jgi:hypothetical protein
MTQTVPTATRITDLSPATATYVFAVCRGADPAALSDLPGQWPDAPVRLLRFGALAAVVQDVPAAAFGQEELRERLSERTELERLARAHHTVVAATAAAAPTVPLPLATLYLGDERARTALRADQDRFAAVLDRLAGRVEWGVKVYARRRRESGARGATTPVPARTGRPVSPGHAYLERVRGARREREQRQEAGLHTAETVDRALRGIAVAGRRLRAHDTGAAGEHGAQLLNAAYLVAEDRQRELVHAIRQLRNDPACRDVEVDVTGPWVPYSFVDGGDGDARG